MNRTPLAAAQTALAADRAYADPALWITRVPDRDVLEQARRLEAEGPEGRSLWGLTFAVKDNIDIASLPTTAGCRDYAYTPAVSAPAVQLLLDAGALLLGKTNLDQFATGLVGVRSPYGIPRNVFSQSARYGTHDRRFLGRLGRRGGGGLVPLALGSDTNGSIRVPASLCRLFGLKPTFGRLPRTGSFPFVSSLDHLGPLARSVGDLALAHDAMQGSDPQDPFCAERPPEPVSASLEAGLSGLRIAQAGGISRRG